MVHRPHAGDLGQVHTVRSLWAETTAHCDANRRCYDVVGVKFTTNQPTQFPSGTDRITKFLSNRYLRREVLSRGRFSSAISCLPFHLPSHAGDTIVITVAPIASFLSSIHSRKIQPEML